MVARCRAICCARHQVGRRPHQTCGRSVTSQAKAGADVREDAGDLRSVAHRIGMKRQVGAEDLCLRDPFPKALDEMQAWFGARTARAAVHPGGIRGGLRRPCGRRKIKDGCGPAAEADVRGLPEDDRGMSALTRSTTWSHRVLVTRARLLWVLGPCTPGGTRSGRFRLLRDAEVSTGTSRCTHDGCLAWRQDRGVADRTWAAPAVRVRGGRDGKVTKEEVATRQESAPTGCFKAGYRLAARGPPTRRINRVAEVGGGKREV